MGSYWKFRDKRLAAKKKSYQAHERERRFKRKYGVTMENLVIMSLEQDNKCLICGREPEKGLQVDHCHESGKVRGLLCFTCNVGLGMFKDNKDLLWSAIKYLERV